jgi:hypothetical protein
MHSMSTSLEYQIEYRCVWIHFEAICEACILWQLHIWDQRYALWIISQSQCLCQLRPCTSAPSVWGWFCVSPIVVHSTYLAAGKGPRHTICGWNVQSLHSMNSAAKLWWCPFWFLSAIWHHYWLSSSSCFRKCNRHSPRTQNSGHRLFAQKFEQISMYSVCTLLMKSVGSDGSGYLTPHSREGDSQSPFMMHCNNLILCGWGS